MHFCSFLLARGRPEDYASAGPESNSELRMQHRWKLVRTGAVILELEMAGGRSDCVSRGVEIRG